MHDAKSWRKKRLDSLTGSALNETKLRKYTMLNDADCHAIFKNIGDMFNITNNSLTRKVTKTNNNDVMTSMKIFFDCNISFSKIIVYTGKFELAWSIILASGETDMQTTSEFGQSHILDLSEFDTSIKEISILSGDNGQFTLKGLRLGGFQNSIRLDSASDIKVEHHLESQSK